jgi:hypothetical protein
MIELATGNYLDAIILCCDEVIGLLKIDLYYRSKMLLAELINWV